MKINKIAKVFSVKIMKVTKCEIRNLPSPGRFRFAGTDCINLRREFGNFFSKDRDCFKRYQFWEEVRESKLREKETALHIWKNYQTRDVGPGWGIRVSRKRL